MKVAFLGAAHEVTGSCYFIETATTGLLVDCGMFRGEREAPAHERRQQVAAIDTGARK